MISSAVIIPEQQSPPRSPPNTLKRRQSSVTSETSKRPRIDTANGTDHSRNGLPSPQSAMSPPRRKSALGNGAAEEKKRGQRLFGALLGTLSQSGPTKPAHRKRDEIEQRQRERAKKESDDREEEQRRRKSRLDQQRREEQVEWDAESVRIRHRNMRAMAEFLQTKSEPVLYYKPWEMRLEEKDTIERQIREVEQQIWRENDGRRMLAKLSEAKGEEAHVSSPNDSNGVKMESEPKVPNCDPGDDTEMKGTATPEAKEPSETPSKQELDDRPSSDTGRPAKVKPTMSEQDEKPVKGNGVDHDHGGEELVEGQEDDVIY